MLHLQIGFPTGRYWAASHANPAEPEWPPHPSRIYSALVAGAYGATGQISEQERRALDLLATAPPPTLAFPDADTRASPQSYVPVNDEASRIHPAKKSHGVLLPNRQARHFPAAYLSGEPEVHVTWSMQLDAETFAALDGIAARTTHIGTSHSFVTARFTQGVGQRPPRMAPATSGSHYLRVPTAGRLDELDQHVARRSSTKLRDALRRHASSCESLVAYREVAAPEQALIAARHDWFALRLDDASWGADTAYSFARAARRALLALLGDQAPPALHGHDMSSAAHLAWLPLPDIGRVHATARIRGLAIGFPRELSAADAAVLVRGLSQLQRLRLPDGQVAQLSPVLEGASTLKALQAWTWCRPSRVWATVTPVILDRPPRRPDPGRLVAAMVESLQLAGLPLPVDVRLSRNSAFEGAPAALDIPTRLPRYHAVLRFTDPVEGPVIAGRWRNFGIGLFRPLDEREAAQALGEAQ